MEYRIIWSDDGYGRPFTGNWSPIDYTFDHIAEAEKIQGHPASGLGIIDVGQALRVEFRRVR